MAPRKLSELLFPSYSGSDNCHTNCDADKRIEMNSSYSTKILRPKKKKETIGAG